MNYIFSKIPQVLSSKEIIDKSFKRSKKISMAKHPDKVAMFRNWDINKLKSMEKSAKETLDSYLKKFPNLSDLDPFHKELVEILVDRDKYKMALGSIKWCRDSIVKLTTKTIKDLEKTREMDDFSKIMNSYFGRFSSFIDGINKDLDYLKIARSKLINVPDVDPELFTIVVAGFPNVGKSELVKSISSAKPEIAPYPFTTKGILIGHRYFGHIKVQIIDTPGLLDRPFNERNDMEKQAILAIKHLADIIIFVLDPSETCGYPMEKQISLLEDIKNNFQSNILEIENKVDIFKSDSSRIKISAKEKINLNELLSRIDKIIGDSDGK
ncbi:MAG: GTPase [Thermoplasmata archaeon]|nr:GTPase [Thermoplasmata archaeon]